MIMHLLLESAVRSLALGAAIGLGLMLFRVRNPNIKSLAWTVALLASLAMPALVYAMQAALPPWAAVSLPSGPAALLQDVQGRSAAAIPADAPRPVPATIDWLAIDWLAIDWLRIATAAYWLVAALLLLRLLTGMALTLRLRRTARRIADGDGLDIRFTAAVTVPVTFGGTILLPAEAEAWSAEKYRAVVAHERAHIARGDFHIQLLAQLNRAIFWFNPFAWWLQRQLADLAEAASDDAAVMALAGHVSYAEILLDVAAGAQRVPAGVAMARSAAVGPRVERILAGITSRPVTRRAGMLIVVLLIPLVIGAAVAIAAPSADPTQAKIDPGIFDRYVGAYEFDPAKAPNQVVTISRTGDHLFINAATGPKIELFPESERLFFEKGVGVRIAFSDGTGPSPSLFLQLDEHARAIEAKRVDEAEAMRVKAIVEQKQSETAKPRTAITVDPNIFDNYAGSYRFAETLLTVTREGDYLFVRLAGQPKLRVFPETDHAFFYKEVDAQISFVTGADGKATKLVLHQDGQDMPANRVGPAEAEAIEARLAKRIADQARPRTAVAIDPKLLDLYVGRYEMSPSNIFTVTRQGDGLFVQFAKQPTIPVYPENDHEFFYTVIPAQISFIVGGRGQATELVLHQNGRDMAAPRME